MRLNHLSVVLFSALSLPLIACGGDDDGGGGVVVPDAKVFMDAPPVQGPACLFPASIPAFTLPESGAPPSMSWIRKGTSGALNGVTYFGITIGLDADGKMEVDFLVPRPTDGFKTNTPYAFSTDPKAMGLPPALAIASDNIDAQGNPYRTLWASSGTLTFTAVGQTQGDAINATISTTNLREIDDNGADVAGGCMTSFAGITLNLQQSTTIQGPSVPTGAPQRIDWSAATTDRLVVQP